jgi:hypothetical protein
MSTGRWDGALSSLGLRRGQGLFRRLETELAVSRKVNEVFLERECP